MMRKQTVILLTACISPGGMAFTALQDAGERERQYIDAINFYIENTYYPIVFSNNSSEDNSSKITTPITNAIIDNKLTGIVCEINRNKMNVIIGNRHVYSPIKSV